MTEHREHADRLEDEVDQLEKRSSELGEEISDVKQDWEAKRQDESVPGAPAPESGLPPEANVTTSGDKPPEDDQDERAPWPDE